MDDREFDFITRILGNAADRRMAWRGLLSLAIGSFTTTRVADEIVAKKKKHKNKHDKKKDDCKGSEKKCGGKCIPKGSCCNNGDCGECQSCQGGACVTGCQSGQTCQGGTCVCNSSSCSGCCDGNTCVANAKACDNTCIALDECCTNSDCADLEECVDHQCEATCDAVGVACATGTSCCSNDCSCNGGKVGNPETNQCHGNTFNQPLSNNVNGWYDWDDLFNAGAGRWPGTHTTIVQVGDHAELVAGSAPLGNLTPMTLWGGYSSLFPAGGYNTELDIFLDATGATPVSTRFEYSSAINTSSCGWQNEFFFAAGKNGAGTFCVRNLQGDNPCSGDSHTILPADSGWHTLRHEFRPDGANVKVTSKLIQGNNVLKTWEATTPLAGVGGNRYGWFSINQFAGLQIKNSRRSPA